jgi:hypothetical protein
MWLLPEAAHSVDVDHWQLVAAVLADGGNPYRDTILLNWPPIWMQLIFALDKTASLLGLPFFRVLQVFLIVVESLLIVGLSLVIRQVAPGVDARKILLWGVALNPVAILLVVQHGNFDTLVALWLVLFAASLLRYGRTGEAADWLAACLFLGLGVVTKTVPFVLAPLLADGFRRSPALVRFIGCSLLLGPVVLGMSIVYVLSPAEVTANVLAYRSFSGWFGVTGLLSLAGYPGLLPVWSAVFSVLTVFALAFATLGIWRRRPDAGETLLLGGLLLAAVPALGPGYAPQYFSWLLAFLPATFAAFPGRWRLVLSGFAAVASITFVVEYALFPSHGMFLTRLSPSEPFVTWSQTLSSQAGQTLVRLPLFLAFLALLGTGLDLLVRAMTESFPAK